MRRSAFGLLLLSLASCRAKPLETAPEVKLPVLLRAPIQKLDSLKELQGNVVVLEFWATWCGPCKETLPHMNKLVQRFEGKPVRFIAVTNESMEKVLQFTRANPMRAWIGLDPGGALAKAFRVRGIPHVVVIDAYGRIQHRVSTSFFYASDVEDALKAKPPSPA